MCDESFSPVRIQLEFQEDQKTKAQWGVQSYPMAMSLGGEISTQFTQVGCHPQKFGSREHGNWVISFLSMTSSFESFLNTQVV